MEQKRIEVIFFPRRIELINRIAEKAMISEAVHSSKNSAIFFIGLGGIGKTRLLQEVSSQPDFLSHGNIRCTDLIDLYHSEFHTPDNVQDHIAQQIDPQDHFFSDYRKIRAEFLAAEEKGLQRKALFELGEKRDAQFLADYQALVKTGQIRPLLLFDTTELIQHESEALQVLCGAQVETVAIHSWLTCVAPLLPNTVILLAGRPKPDIENQIEEAFEQHEWDFRRHNLDVLEQADAILYINALSQGSPVLQALNPADKEWIVAFTGGRPILLALALQYIHYSKGIDQLRAEIDSGEEREKVLMLHLDNLAGDYGDGMHYMLLARNGMDPALLAHLTHWPEERIERFFKAMQGNVLFKSRGGTLFLHDELYELYDKYFRDSKSTTEDYAKIDRYYEVLLEKPLAYKDLLMLRTQALYYALRHNPEEGYQKFAVWDEEAIWLHFRSADLSLRDVMLRFANRYLHEGEPFFDQRLAEQFPVQILDTENAVRCIERALAEEKYDQVLLMAQSILHSTASVYLQRIQTDILFRARIMYPQAEAALYRGEDVKDHLKTLVSLLEAFEPENDTQKFWKHRTLGRAYNRFGYYYRVNGFYAKAIPFYRKAVSEFRSANLIYLLAQTLTNLAFILAQTGDTETALEHAKDARKIWDSYGMSYRKALTLSALARILVEANRPLAALKEIEKAEEILKKHDEPRAEVLLMINKGRALRKQGNMWKEEIEQYPIEKADEYMASGREILGQAEGRLSAKELNDALSLWEINNELGSLYCDWAWLHRKRGNRELAADSYCKSLQYHKRAFEIAEDREMPFQRADSLDDLAQAYGDRAFFQFEDGQDEEAKESLLLGENALREAEAKVPSAYLRSQQMSILFSPEDHEDGAPYWLVLGKVNMWRGVWKFRLLEHEGRLSLHRAPTLLEEATEYLLASQAYFTRFGENSLAIDRNMRYLSGFMAQAKVTYQWMETQIKKAEDKYRTKLPVARSRMQNKLGQ